MNLKNLLLASFAGASLTAALAQTPVTVVITGATAFRDIAYNRVAAILTGETQVNGANSNIRSFTNGSITIGGTTYSPVNIHFSQNGSAAGMQALINPVNLPLAVGGTGQAVAAFSDVFPETAQLSGGLFDGATVGVVPFWLIYKPSISPGLSSVTNLSQRQTTALFEKAGTLPARFFGGSTDDIVYLCGRDTGSGTRLCTDACTYFTSAAANYQWNTNTLAWQVSATGGYSSGSFVNADLQAGPYGIGYASPNDTAGLTPILYNGFAPNIVNVQKGYYEIWGYEHLFYRKSGGTAPTANQKAILTALSAAIRSNAYQTDPAQLYFQRGFVPQDGMEVQRTSDGGPLESLLY